MLCNSTPDEAQSRKPRNLRGMSDVETLLPAANSCLEDLAANGFLEDSDQFRAASAAGI